MIFEIKGENVKSENDFHKLISDGFCVGGCYGGNLDALWDLLSANVERPLTLRWTNASVSKAYLGNVFDEIIVILERVKRQDEGFGWKDGFDYRIEM